MARVLGKAVIRVDGEDIRSYPGADLDIGGHTREARVGHVFHGYSEGEKQSELTCEIDLDANRSLARIRAWSDVTIVFETDVGPDFIINNAFLTTPPTVSDGTDSKVSLSFAGPPAEEL